MIIAFEGGAGCGKTHRLIDSLGSILEDNALKPGQRVLATTYVHGSRKRLDTRLRDLPVLQGNYECSTLDSVAWRWMWRWRSLAARITDHLPGHREFDAVCSVTANLLDVPDVRAWVAKSFPIVLVDEAQDLTRERLSIVKSLAKNSILLVAADEFQCLQNALRPNPFSEWSVAELNLQRLERVWRTDVADLLGAAATIRDGRPPPTGRDFQTIAAPNANLAGTYLANQIGWRGRNNSIAVLAPTITRYVSDTVNWAQANRTRQGNGPYAISWERTEQAEFTDLCARLNMPARATNAEALVAIGELGTRVASDLRSWLWKQRNVLGITEVSRTDVELAIEASLANRRRFARASNPKLSAMTIHAAKNREFDGVVLLWPFQVGGDADQKRRLLYNAITRARKWCIVLTQGQAILNAPPFA